MCWTGDSKEGVDGRRRGRPRHALEERVSGLEGLDAENPAPAPEPPVE